MDTFLEVWYSEVRTRFYPPEKQKLFRAGKLVMIALMLDADSEFSSDSYARVH